MPLAISRIQVRSVVACFFISGVAGLIYQIAWAKALGLIFGHTVYAVTAVLAVFMAGLAVGAGYFGRFSDRSSDPIGLYAGLELLVGLTGALSLFGLHSAHLLYIAFYPTLAGSRPILIAMRAVGAVIVLFLPTFLMGGTFPVLVAAVSHRREDFPQRVSQLYWANTAGAVSGAVLAGFALLPSIGLRLTIVVAVALNMIAAFLARSLRKSGQTRDIPLKIAPSVMLAERRLPLVLLLLIAVVGASAFMYEIAWTRMLAIVGVNFFL